MFKKQFIEEKIGSTMLITVGFLYNIKLPNFVAINCDTCMAREGSLLIYN